MLAAVPLFMGLWLVPPHCITSIQEAEREALPLWLRNGTEASVDAVNSCSVRPEAGCPKELNQIKVCLGFLVCGFVLQSSTPVTQMCGALEYLGQVFGSYLAHLLSLYMSLFWVFMGCKEQKGREGEPPCTGCD